MSGRIDLAHAAPFTLGALAVRPSTREVAHGDGAVEVLEPRVMQVLVALHRAGGAIVSRDDLTHSCWEGRVVGEDAINRVISRLRRAAEGIGGGAFRIETVTKVGYRLVGGGEAPEPAVAAPATAVPPAASPPNRRRVIGGAAAVAGVAALGGGWWWTHRAPTGPPADIAPMLAQARQAIVQLDRGGEAEAVELYRRATELRPDYADAWGNLAYAYCMLGNMSPTGREADAYARSRAAARRALDLDPGNPFAQLALELLRPLVGNWLELDRVTRDGLSRRPGDELLLLYRSGVFTWTGRCAESAAILAPIVQNDSPGPGPSYSLAIELWGAGQPDDADRAMDKAFRLFPLNPLIWFARVSMLLYTDRAAEALTMVRDTGSRPAGIGEEAFTPIAATAQALVSRAPADIEAAMQANLVRARQKAVGCPDAINFASTIGRLDDAFMLANALYFDRPWPIGTPQPMVRVGGTPVHDRSTIWPFMPPVAAMRRDPRFAILTKRLGLDDYWRQSGSRPDYQRG